MKKIISLITLTFCYCIAYSQNCTFPNTPSSNQKVVKHTIGVLANVIDVNMEADFFDYQGKSRLIPMSKNVFGNSIVIINQFEFMEVMNTEVEWLIDYETFKSLEHIQSRKFQTAVNEFNASTLKVIKNDQHYCVRSKIFYPSKNWLEWDVLLELYQLKNGTLEKLFDKKKQYQSIRPDFLCIAATQLFQTK
jgi:hypothetical protein